MIRCPLSALRNVALGTAALTAMSSYAVAQRASKPKSDPPKHAATKPAISGDNTAVGSVNGKVVTWGDLVSKLRKDSPDLLDQSIGVVIAAKASKAMFGPNGKDSFTITKAEALNELRQHPNTQISQQLQLMLTTMAVDQEATRDGIQPTSKQIDAKIADLFDSLRKNGTIPAGQTNAQFLAAHNTSLDKLKTNFKPQCQILNIIHFDMAKQLGHAVGPDDMLQASHILIAIKDLSPTATPAEKLKADQDAEGKIKGILSDIRAGKISFVDAAKANSEDPGSKDKGGDLGIFMRGMMLKEFEVASFAAKTNVVTEPVKSPAGYHIILVTKTGKDLTAVERKAFLDKHEEEQIRTYLSKVVEKDNKVENKLAGLVPPPQQPNGFGGGPPRGP